ncbi:MAG: hypothetical protein Q7S33_05610 [Nanoarchaeota archaeon]|nr:hypothetical protein [Nanoarchaeota archaeon]
MIINKIFNGISDEEVHSEFLKFGKGIFKNKYMISAKKQKDLWNIKTGAEFANSLVRIMAEKIGINKIMINGVIVSTLKLKEEPEFFKILANCEVKQFMGIKQFKINQELSGKEIIELMNKFPRAFFALTFKTSDSELKVKPKAPKSAKPSTSAEKEVKIDFCSLKTSNKEIVKELFFDIGDFNEIRISHTLKIDDIIYPKNEKDPIKVRELSQRKGILVREIEIDGQKKVVEKAFLA